MSFRIKIAKLTLLLKCATLNRIQLQMEMSSFLTVPGAIPREHKQMQGEGGICVNEEQQAVQRWTKAIGCLCTGISAQVA